MARELQRSAAESSGGAILGTSAAVTRLRREIALVAASDLAVLITGETGVGKELVAHHVHAASARADEALIHVNCAALPLSIAESELFGHVAGAFTGAVRDRAGKFEVADGGTLFLDEIGELSLEIQPKLLRVLQHGEIQRVGSDRAHRVNVRVIAATNRDLAREVAAGRFRADLFHRLAVVPAARAAAARAARRHPRARRALRRRGGAAARPGGRAADGWRASRSLVERRLAGQRPRARERGRPRRAARLVRPRSPRKSSSSTRRTSTCPPTVAEPRSASAADPARPARGQLAERLERFEREAIATAVARHGGNWAAAARELGLHRSNLHHRATRLGLK